MAAGYMCSGIHSEAQAVAHLGINATRLRSLARESACHSFRCLLAMRGKCAWADAGPYVVAQLLAGAAAALAFKGLTGDQD